MRTRYASVPSHDEDAEHELEQAFAISDDEDDDRAHHQNTPLLQHASQGNRQRDEEQETSRTPHTAQSRPVIDGRYNFEYDFPPPGSPPEALAGPNHWGNTNGILVTQPVSPPDVQPTWLTRTWRRVTGRGETVVPSRPIGGGTINDGVFANLSSRPTGSRSTAGGPGAVRNPSEPESSFHAPEIAPDDAPPSYLAAQLDAAPPYWENTVLATTPDEYLIDSIPAGSLFGFVWSFFVSLSLQWIGFALAYMLSSSHAGRYGAKAGLGITFVQLGLWFRERGKNSNEIPNDIWWPTDDQTDTNPVGNLPPNSTVPSIPPALTNVTAPWTDASNVVATDWLALFLMTMGWFMFMSSVLGYWRVKRWEHSLRASAPTRVIGPEGIPPPRRRLGEEDYYSNLMRAYGVPAPSPPLPPIPNTERDSTRNRTETVPNEQDVELDDLEAAPLTTPQRIELEDRIENAVEQRLRRDLSSLGYL